jgi:hypothetical protein
MDLRRTRILFDSPGPFLTVHVEVGAGTDDAGRRADERWSRLRARLEQARVRAQLVEDIGDRLGEALDVRGAARRTIVATEDGVVFDEVQVADSSWPETAELFEPLPDLAGWLWVEDRAGNGEAEKRAAADLLARAAGAGAAHGVDEVLDALVHDRVDRVFLDLAAARTLTVRPAQHEGLALPAAAAVRDALPADRVVVAAAAATDTALSLDSALGGVSAVLRTPG